MWPFKKKAQSPREVDFAEEVATAKRLETINETQDFILLAGHSKEFGGIPLSINDLQDFMCHGYTAINYHGAGGRGWYAFRKEDGHDANWLCEQYLMKQNAK